MSAVVTRPQSELQKPALHRPFRACNCCTPKRNPASAARRNFLAGGIAALGLSVSAASSAAAQTAAPAKMRIDVHHHYVPPVHAEAMAGSHADKVPKWTAESSLDDLDRADVATAALSLVPPGVWFGDAEATRKLARECNDYVDAAARRLSCRARCTAQQSCHTFARE